jgi:hypothetical protein
VTKRRPMIKVLYTTGYAGTALASDGTLGSDASVVQKPFSRDGLAAQVRAVLDGYAMA